MKKLKNKGIRIGTLIEIALLIAVLLVMLLPGGVVITPIGIPSLDSGVVLASPGPQYARPSADLTIGLWTDNAGGSIDIYLAIDEATAGDADFIQSRGIKKTQTDTADIRLSSVTDPVSSTGHIVRYRYRADANGANPMNITVELREGDSVASTLIASQAHTGIPITWTSGNFTLTATEADSITDYGVLFFRFFASAGGGATTRMSQISWAEFEVPSPPAADISNTPSSFGFGLLAQGATANTTLTCFTVTNNGSSNVTITIGGTDMIGDFPWILSNDGSASATEYGLKAGRQGDGDYTIIVNKAGGNTLVSNLAVSANRSWGLKIWAPTTFTGGGLVSGNVTLTATPS